MAIFKLIRMHGVRQVKIPGNEELSFNLLGVTCLLIYLNGGRGGGGGGGGDSIWVLD